MVRIGQLLKYLAALNPQTSPVRLALYNYLNHFHQSEQILNFEVLNIFFNHCLEYPHWQQNKTSLGKEVHQLIENFAMNLPADEAKNIGSEKIRWPYDLQVIELESFHDFSECIHNYLSIHYTQGEKFRIIADQAKKLVAVVLFPEGQVRIRCFDKKFTIRSGVLEPLRTDLSIAYNSKLELSSAVTHRIELGPYTCAQFDLIEGNIVGSAVRGYLFQKYQDFRGGTLSDHLKLFYSIKRLEQYFVDRRTDPFYQELIESLEKTTTFLKMNDSEAIRYCPHLLAQSEAAYEQVFMGDKLLGLLIRDLQSLWQTKQTPQKLDLTNL